MDIEHDLYHALLAACVTAEGVSIQSEVGPVRTAVQGGAIIASLPPVTLTLTIERADAFAVAALRKVLGQVEAWAAEMRGAGLAPALADDP